MCDSGVGVLRDESVYGFISMYILEFLINACFWKIALIWTHFLHDEDELELGTCITLPDRILQNAVQFCWTQGG